MFVSNLRQVGMLSRYSNNKIDNHNITEISLKVALNTITHPPPPPIVTEWKMYNFNICYITQKNYYELEQNQFKSISLFFRDKVYAIHHRYNYFLFLTSVLTVLRHHGHAYGFCRYFYLKHNYNSHKQNYIIVIFWFFQQQRLKDIISIPSFGDYIHLKANLKTPLSILKLTTLVSIILVTKCFN
jgi:hypothetical protein